MTVACVQTPYFLPDAEEIGDVCTQATMTEVIFGNMKNCFQIKKKLEIIVYPGKKK